MGDRTGRGTQGGAAIVTESGDRRQLSGLPAASSQAGARTRHYDTTEGAGFAKIYVPAFGADYVFTVIEGTNADDLYVGPGHYIGHPIPRRAGQLRASPATGCPRGRRSTTSVC